ncbi:DUF192 domain-containing protein [Rhodospirillum sp. A1_3_36]|uniref:DUF192 domain-containing protein n=1 Tax=Rhodospirillum sp. A1_3_36 TaxID=3391666 RepID=UPI0039A757AD
MRLRAVLIAMGLGVLVLASWGGEAARAADPVEALPSTQGMFPQDKVIIATDDGRHVPFVVEIASDAQQRSLGLMYRKELAADAGMLFLWPNSGERTMWMKNTYIPLDMLFVDGDGYVVKVVANTKPHDLTHISSGFPAKGVLEINAGTARLLSLEQGDRILYPGLNEEK